MVSTPMDTVVMQQLPTTTVMPARLTMATMPTMDFTSVMLRLNQRLMLFTETSMAILDMVLVHLDTAATLQLPTRMDMPAQPTMAITPTVDSTSVMPKLNQGPMLIMLDMDTQAMLQWSCPIQLWWI